MIANGSRELIVIEIPISQINVRPATGGFTSFHRVFVLTHLRNAYVALCADRGKSCRKYRLPAVVLLGYRPSVWKTGRPFPFRSFDLTRENCVLTIRSE